MKSINNHDVHLVVSNISLNDCSIVKFNSNLYGLSKQHEFTVTLISKKQIYFDFSDVIPATLSWQNNENRQIIRGYITACGECLDQAEQFTYKLKLSSPLSLLVLSQKNRTFINKTIPEIIALVLRGVLGHYFLLKFKLHQVYAKQPFIAQYNQHDFDFLMEIVNVHKISFYFSHDQHVSSLIFYDSKEALTLIQMRSEFYFTSQPCLCDDKKYAFNYIAQQHADKTIINLQTDDCSLLPGQIVELKKHPVQEFNRAYRIVSLSHHFKLVSSYFNQLTLIPAEENIPSAKRKKRKLSLITQGEICSSIGEQGYYSVRFYFDQDRCKSHAIKCIQPYGGKTISQAYGIHGGLKPGVEVAIGFEDDDLSKPIILGVLSHGLACSPTTSKNPTQNRLRSWGGNELLFDDSSEKNKISLHTQDEKQALHLISSNNASHIQLACNNGDMLVSAKQSMTIKSHIKALQAGKDYYLSAGEQTVIVNQGNIQIQAGKNLLLKSCDDLYLASANGDIGISNKHNVELKSWQGINIKTEGHNLNIQSKKGAIEIKSKGANIFAKGKVDVGSAISMSQGRLSFSQLILAAPIINIYPPMLSTAPQVVNSRLIQLIQKQAKRKQKSIKLFPLIALNLRADYDNLYFKSEKITNDLYGNEKLSPVELAYFANHGNNATIFIHGYNVAYGEFGGKVDALDKEGLQKSVFKYQDVFRDRDILEDQFPDAKINGKVLSSSGQLVLNQQANTINALYTAIQQPVHDVDMLLNGVDSHNWWLHMEWNLNKATGQFDGSDYQHYARMLHVAWQGDPKSPLDYMAALKPAKYTAQKLVPVIRQLHAAGIEVNIIAHSLGNQVLLETMNLLGKISRNIINCVFMWDAAVADHALSETVLSTDKSQFYFFPYAVRSTKRIITLCSEHDNILGPLNAENPALLGKAIDAGLAMALMIKALDIIDHKIGLRKIKSIYNIANTFEYPFSDFLQDQHFRRQYYRDWILSNGSVDERPFEQELNDQLIIIKTRYPHAFNLISIAMATIKYGVKYTLKHWGNYKLHQSIRHPINDQDCNEVATIVVTVFISAGEEPSSAMGYLGPDVGSIRKLDQKLTVIHQTPWLYSHSGMKIPSDDLMREVYRKKIWQEVSSYHFGTYKK